MGPFVFPIFAFILWEFPSMVMMSVHKLICAFTGGSFADQFLGIWAYRLIGLFVYWPVLMLTASVAIGAGAAGGLGRILLGFEVLATLVVLVWFRTGRRGA